MKKTILAISILLLTCLSFAAEKTAKQKTAYPEMTSDMRAKMADMHQQMATCLKSPKTFEECHSEMATSCQDFGQMMPMMGPGMMHDHHEMMENHHGMMGGYPGMMTGFCGDQWLQDKNSKATKTKK